MVTATSPGNAHGKNSPKGDETRRYYMAMMLVKPLLDAQRYRAPHEMVILQVLKSSRISAEFIDPFAMFGRCTSDRGWHSREQLVQY